MSLSRQFPRFIRQFERAFEDPFFRSPFASPASRFWNDFDPVFNGLARTPAVDVSETATAYKIQAEVPGIPKENIQIELTDPRTLVIKGSFDRTSSPEQSAEQSAEPVSKDGQPPNFLAQERMAGSFRRTFTMPVAITESNIKAHLKDGLLSVDIAKPEDQKQIPISIAIGDK
ncbi:HSP20-like chaperone [Polychytrium aggregatum]|uniref:HSP20-like chaperone n=1 Tax=Polychytrium aggregatum TaxID=110093 RepID=UPI0022FDF684|nr:HSP20-like chaperone [Polychytrium aggregatum]KAI9206766.1 HSP20-like chaperone [Polychytrium aggregatum]